VENVSFTIEAGETLGLVGESGCGKTTVGRTILRLIEPTSGSVHFENQNVFDFDQRQLKRMRRDMQIIFQDPYSSLNSRMPVGENIAEGLLIHGMRNKTERQDIVIELLRRVGLEDYHARRFPHEFSGGQRQRIGIARALALRPKFIVCDEPVSALDVSIQSHVLNLLHELQEDLCCRAYIGSSGGDVFGDHRRNRQPRATIPEPTSSLHSGTHVCESDS
jgi:peptide/nickel transport system ATP-binding protein/oligopeptide transport system ATP-binding protein